MTAPSQGFFQPSIESTLTQTLETLKNQLTLQTQSMPTSELCSMYIKISTAEPTPQQGTQHLFNHKSPHQAPLLTLNAQMRGELIKGIARYVALQKLPHQALQDLLNSPEQKQPIKGHHFT